MDQYPKFEGLRTTIDSFAIPERLNSPEVDGMVRIRRLTSEHHVQRSVDNRGVQRQQENDQFLEEENEWSREIEFELVEERFILGSVKVVFGDVMKSSRLRESERASTEEHWRVRLWDE